MKHHFLVLSVILLALNVLRPALASAQKGNRAETIATKQEGELIPNDPSLKIGKLSNGLTYYIKKNTEPKNRAVLYLAVKVGSILETDEQRGLAHFTEHMAFKGTKDFPKKELINYLEKAGVKFGADLNAYTGHDETVYMLPIPTDSAALFSNGFKILANWAGYVNMEGSEIDSERGVIIEEERQRGKDADSRIFDALYPVWLNGSRYVERAPIGKVEIIKNFEHAEIRQFYKDWYRPDLQAVIAVGDFDVAAVEKMIIDNFSPFKNPVNPKPRLSYTVLNHQEPLVKIVTDKEYAHIVAEINIKHKRHPLKTVGDAKRKLMVNMINSMIENRIESLNEKGIATFVNASIRYDQFVINDLESLRIWAVSKSPQELQKALSEVVIEAERMKRFGFTVSELETVKKKMFAENETEYKEKDKTASVELVNKYLEHFLNDTEISGPEYRYNLINKLLSEISLADVNKTALAMFGTENMTITVRAPEKDKDRLPTAADLLKVIKTDGEGVTAYVDNKVDKSLIDKKPTPGKIVSEKKIDAVGVTELTFSNGVKAVLKPTVFKNDQIIFYSFGQGGTSLASDEKYFPANFTELIYGSGIGTFDQSQLRKLLAGSTAAVSPYVNDFFHGYKGSSSPKDLETALQLVYAYGTQPRKDEAFFKKNIENVKTYLVGRGTQPEAVYRDTINTVFSSGHKRGRIMTVAEMDQISLADAFDFYKERFADASNQTFVFVGNFEVEKIKSLLSAYLGGLPSLGLNEKYFDHGVKPLQGNISKTITMGLEDKATVKLFFHGNYEYSSNNNMQLNALNEILALKIMERLRGKESGVYGPSVELSLESQPHLYYKFTVTFNCAKANVDKLVDAALEEVEKIRQIGGTLMEIEKLKAEMSRHNELGLADNSYWLAHLMHCYKNDRELTSILHLKERLDKVTVDSTKAAAQRYLNGANFFKAILVPEK